MKKKAQVIRTPKHRLQPNYIWGWVIGNWITLIVDNIE